MTFATGNPETNRRERAVAQLKDNVVKWSLELRDASSAWDRWHSGAITDPQGFWTTQHDEVQARLKQAKKRFDVACEIFDRALREPTSDPVLLALEADC